jgi:hypothetical protein
MNSDKDVIQQKGNFGVGVNKGHIHATNLGGVINNEVPSKSLAEAAAEIQQLLVQLEKSYSTDTTKGKMALATEAIARIEDDKSWKVRVMSALKAGGVSAFEQFLSHPAASFVISALDDWQQGKG